LRSAISTVANARRGLAVPDAAASRITASSSTTVALVSSTTVCTVYRVNRVTSPGSPQARLTSGVPIITVLPKVVASASTAARRLKPHTSRVPAKITITARKYAATGRKSSCCTWTWLMVRNSKAGPSSRNTRFDRSFTASDRIQPRRAAVNPMAINRTTGVSAWKTGFTD
jgi:hypothetical protein